AGHSACRCHAGESRFPLGRPAVEPVRGCADFGYRRYRRWRGRMANATQVLAAFREMIANKNMSRDDLHDLIKDGIMAALARRYGPNVEAEVIIDEEAGDINITVLKEVVA